MWRRYKDLVDDEDHERLTRIMTALEKKDDMQQRMAAITKSAICLPFTAIHAAQSRRTACAWLSCQGQGERCLPLGLSSNGTKAAYVADARALPGYSAVARSGHSELPCHLPFFAGLLVILTPVLSNQKDNRWVKFQRQSFPLHHRGDKPGGPTLDLLCVSRWLILAKTLLPLSGGTTHYA